MTQHRERFENPLLPTPGQLMLNSIQKRPDVHNRFVHKIAFLPPPRPEKCQF